MLVGTFHIHAVYKRAKTDKARRAQADSPSMVKSGMPPCSSAQLAMLVAAALNMQCCESQAQPCGRIVRTHEDAANQFTRHALSVTAVLTS